MLSNDPSKQNQFSPDHKRWRHPAEFGRVYQFAELGVNLISPPIETINETLMQNITCIKKKLELKVGV